MDGKKMNMYKTTTTPLISVFFVLLFVITSTMLVSCFKSDDKEIEISIVDKENDNDSGDASLTKGFIDFTTTFDGCTVISANDCVKIINNTFKIHPSEGITTIIVSDGENTPLIIRGLFNAGDGIKIDSDIIAKSLVSMHPLLILCSSTDIECLYEKISECSGYSELKEIVESEIIVKGDLLSESNECLQNAVASVVEELSNNALVFLKDTYGDNIEELYEITQTRSNYEFEKIPMMFSVNANRLTAKLYALAPSFYGNVTINNSTSQKFDVKARDDYGLLDLIFNRTWNGPESEFTFVDEGEYRFKFRSDNVLGSLDFYYRIVKSMVQALGYDTLEEEVLITIISRVSSTIIDGEINFSALFSDVVGIIIDELVREIETRPESFSKYLGSEIEKFGRAIGRACRIYGVVLKSGNILGRISFASFGDKQIDFSLCYYNGEVENCARVSIFLESGNNQKTKAKFKLDDPLVVQVCIYDENESVEKI